jgi:acyl-CoA thioesterase-1
MTAPSIRTLIRRRMAVAAASLLASVSMQSASAEPACDIPPDLIRLDHALPRVAARLADRQPVVVVAMGSSSTSGYGASSPAATYPSRLQEELTRAFPGASITVVNKGVGGNELADMLKRFDADIVAQKPDLVVWQLDTNAVVRLRPLDAQPGMIKEGLNKIRATGADVVLMDPQYVLDVITKPGAQPMEDLIATVAKQENVDLFRRYDVMRHWVTSANLTFADFTIRKDNLHMNDLGQACEAKGLGAAIAEAVRRPTITASALFQAAP